LVVGEFGGWARDGGRPEPGPLKVPCPADAGYTERVGGKLLAVEGEALPADGVPHEVPPVFRRGCQPAVNLDVEAVAVEALVRAVDGKVGDGASLAEGSR
jgi:hypothetical protein